MSLCSLLHQSGLEERKVICVTLPFRSVQTAHWEELHGNSALIQAQVSLYHWRHLRLYRWILVDPSKSYTFIIFV